MRKPQLSMIAVLLIWVAGLGTAQSIEDLSRVLDLHGSLKAITQAAQAGRADPNRLYLIAGNIDYITIFATTVNPDTQIFQRAEAALTEAYWTEGKNAIIQFPAILLIGPRFGDKVSDSLSDDPTMLSPRKDVLVVVRFRELRRVGNAQVPVLEVLDYRLR